MSPLPARELRRQPYAHELAAAVDFAALEALYVSAAEELDALFAGTWLPEQVAAVVDGIVHTRSGGDRQRIRAVDMARLQVPVVGVEALAEALYDVAVGGAEEARAELGAQGLELAAPSEAVLRAATLDHAQAVAQLLADGLALAARRRAVQLSGAGLTPAELAAEVDSYLNDLEHRWERDQLAGAVQQATNAGRLEVFGEVEDATGAYASELLDAATCDDCRSIDGTNFASLAEARAAYPTGGYRNCRGGPRCRGTIVLVLAGETAPGTTSTV